MIADFHFIRPWWLVALLPLGFIVWLIHHRQDATQAWRSRLVPPFPGHRREGRAGDGLLAQAHRALEQTHRRSVEPPPRARHRHRRRRHRRVPCTRADCRARTIRNLQPKIMARGCRCAGRRHHRSTSANPRVMARRLAPRTSPGNSSTSSPT